MRTKQARAWLAAGQPGVVLSTLSLTLSGLWLLNPWFFTFGQNKAWEFMASVAPEEVWGALFVVSGLLAAWGGRSGNRRLLRFGLMLVFMCRAFLLAAFAYSSRGLLQGVPEYLSWTLLAGWVYLRVNLRPGEERGSQ